MQVLFFWIFSVLGIGCAAMMVTKRNPIHSALFLVVTILSLAGLYLLLGAEFLAAIQVIVYAGAIMVLFLFVIMVVRPKEESLWGGAGWIGIVGLMLVVIIFMWFIKAIGLALLPKASRLGLKALNTASLGRELFSHYIVPFEAISILLLVALVGVVVLGRRGK